MVTKSITVKKFKVVKEVNLEKKVFFDPTASINADLDEISKRMHLSEGSIDMGEPMSTGNLTLDIIMGGGIKPAMYTFAGNEQSAKTTNALMIMAAGIIAKIPAIRLFDYEGCFKADTLISHNNGTQTKLKDLFNFSNLSTWKPETLVGQSRTDIDTVEFGHKSRSTGKRLGSLFYKGQMPTTKVTFNTGHYLEGYAHKMFVMRNGAAHVILLEDLKVGESVLVSRNLNQEEEIWKPVLGFGSVIKSRYQVSNLGRVKSIDFSVSFSKTCKSGVTIDVEKIVKGRILKGLAVKDGHLWVALCDGVKQRKRLIHRIVARTFIGKATVSKPLVLHWNDSPSDNRLINIRYGSSKDNAIDIVTRYRGACGEKATNSKSTPKQVLKIIELNKKGVDVKTLSIKYKVNTNSIYSIVKGNSWSHLTKTENIPLELTETVLKDYELAAVTSVTLTGKTEHVFDISLRGVANDVLPHSIITNGIVTHNSSSNSLGYIQQLLKTAGVNKTVKEVFGEKDDTTGKWVIPPIVRYSEETVGEVMFDYMNSFLRKLPDKKRIAGKWWYIYEDTKINKAKFSEHANQNMARKYGAGIYVEAEDGRLQALIITDSLAAMNPTANDDDEANNSLGLQARMFSHHFKRIKGRMAPKRVALIATNQLRDIPMARYGPTQKEAAGNAALFNSDCRNWFAKRALSGAPFNPKGFKSPEGNVDSSIESEPSVDVPGGFDTYSYIAVTNVKNKMSNPKRKGWIRLWTEDANGVARGIDPVFDTINYLKNTGQLVCKNRRTMTLNLEGFGTASKNLTWSEIKQWVLGDKKTMSEISAKVGYKPLSLRAFCFKQIKDKSFEALYNSHKNAKSKNGSDDDEDESTED